VRWWLNTDHKAFGLDNASVQGLDFSALDPDIWMVQWTDGRGEIERQDIDANENLNGLRENFIDVMPYAPLFRQFLQLTPDLSLEQAKKIQIELVNTIFDSKRQMPFHYAVAAGDYWWDASDASMGAATIPSIQNINTSLNNTIAQVNAILNHLNSVISLINSGVSAVGNSLAVQINQSIVDATNNALNTVNGLFININSVMADTGNSVVTHINDVILSTYGGTVNSINYGLHTVVLATDITGAKGISDSIAAGPYSFGHVGTNPYFDSYVSASFASFSSLGLAPLPPVSGTNVQWIPIGSTTPVNVTPAEQQAILQGIATRTNQLNLVRNSKNAAINALTTIDAVINYDVTTGWPATPMPPGFQLWQPMSNGGGTASVVFTGSGTTSGGIPEAPSDGVTYGRKDMTWNPALAKSGDMLDGGSF